MLALSNSGVDRFRSDLAKLPLVPAGSRLGLAVSGGPDSTALAWLSRTALPDVHLRVAVVDHGLRPESAAEAALVQQRMQAMGLEADILTWTPPQNLKSAKMEQARLARYWLLQGWAKQRGLLRVWLGHHADDQRETIAMRQRQGTSIEGLRGMDQTRLAPETLFERPLLFWRKDDLVQVCRDNDLTFVEDPTNRDVSTERGRLRATGELHTEPHAPDLAHSSARRAQTAGMVTHELGHLWVRREALTAEALQAGCAWVRGGNYAPSIERAQRTVDGLAQARRVALFGCVVEHRSENWVLIAREARRQNALNPRRMEDGRWRVDDRWIVDQPGGEWGFVGATVLTGADALVARATAACLTWNGAVPRFDGSALVWERTRAVFSPRRPLILTH